MFKRILLVTAAVSMLAAPMAQAQSRYDGPRHGSHHSQSHKHGKPQVKAPSRHHAKRPAAKRHSWQRGHRVPNWQRQQRVRDYHRHGLKRPGHGQHWVKVGNEYLLISIATGIILGLAAAR